MTQGGSGVLEEMHEMNDFTEADVSRTYDESHKFMVFLAGTWKGVKVALEDGMLKMTPGAKTDCFISERLADVVRMHGEGFAVRCMQ